MASPEELSPAGRNRRLLIGMGLGVVADELLTRGVPKSIDLYNADREEAARQESIAKFIKLQEAGLTEITDSSELFHSIGGDWREFRTDSGTLFVAADIHTKGKPIEGVAFTASWPGAHNPSGWPLVAFAEVPQTNGIYAAYARLASLGVPSDINLMHLGFDVVTKPIDNNGRYVKESPDGLREISIRQ